MIDFEEDAESQGPTQEQLSRVSSLAAQQTDLDQRIAETEDMLKDLKEKRRKIAEDALPEALEEAGLSSFTTSDGTQVEVREKLYCSVPKSRKDAIREWLEQEGHGALVKYAVSTELSPDQRDQVEQVAAKIRELGLDPKTEPDFNTGQLKSLLNEYLESGENIDLRFFGAHLHRATEVKSKR